MKIYDFSGNDFGNEYMTENDHISVLKILNRDGEIILKMLVADRKGKRIVFLVPSGEILQVKGYSDESVKIILECATEIKDELIQSLKDVEEEDEIIAESKKKDLPF